MRPKSRSDFTVAIICALPTEAEAVEELFDETYDTLSQYYGKQAGDDNTYTTGRMGKHQVVLCYMPGMGKRNAASVVSSLKTSYTRIEIALAVGICGGVPFPPGQTSIFLGDVIISDAVIEYDFGRQHPGGFQRKNGVKETLGQPNREVRSFLVGLRTKRTRGEFRERVFGCMRSLQQSDHKWAYPGEELDVLCEPSHRHKHHPHEGWKMCSCMRKDSAISVCTEALETDCDVLGCRGSRVSHDRPDMEDTRPAIHIGTIASADTVMRSGEHRDALAREEDVIGFDMEGAGIWDNISCLVIKGVSDYADSHKDKRWQAYAAAAGAAGARTFLEYWRPAFQVQDMSSCWLVPFTRNPRFTGRQDEVTRLEELVFDGRGPRKVAIAGLGGIGKTQIALELAYRIRDRDDEYSVFWVPCTSFASVEQAYISIAQLLGIHGTSPSETKERLKVFLSQKGAGKWLLIFDNADESDMWLQGRGLAEFLPQSEHGRVIFTTRNQKLAVTLASSNIIQVSGLDERTAMSILQESLVQKEMLGDRKSTLDLLTQLAFLPLAIVQAATYINENSISLADYVQLLQEHESEVITLLSADFGDDWRYRDMQNPVATTWLVSFQQIRRSNPVAAEYLSIMGCLHPRDIPQSLLPHVLSRKEEMEAIGLLRAYSFISPSDTGDRSHFSLHRLVHLSIRNWLRLNQQFVPYILKTADILQKEFPTEADCNRSLWRQYLPHALALIGENDFHERRQGYTLFLQNVAACLLSDGRYKEAEDILVHLVHLLKGTYRADNQHTLIILSMLSSTYQSQKRMTEAEDLQLQIIEASQRVLGPKNLDTMSCIRGLAEIYCFQGRMQEAEELQKQVTEAYTQVLGPLHLYTLRSVHTVIYIYQAQGRYKEAADLAEGVLKTLNQIQGPNDLQTLHAMVSLASIHCLQEKNKIAKKLLNHVLEVREEILGAEHPDTLDCVGRLAAVYHDQGQWKKSEELTIQVLEGNKQMLGLRHPTTLASLDDLGECYQWQKRWKEAEKIHLEVWEYRKQLLGPTHPESLRSMLNVAWTWNGLCKRDDAVALMTECVQLRRQILGPHHPSTTSARNLLRRCESQRRLYRRLAKIPIITGFLRKEEGTV
ncbi:hypothetical protein BDV59DRAFT_43185 [Aspergillus ambiguus]|uniref:uncharacterized protein n=1 Tax=Aspergillus ambiguus TaxID=176160 RepID=UPI003CCE0E81